jgi:hypothetical protein
MKKTLAIVLTVIFLGTSLTFTAFANTKAGSACKKLGQINTSAGKKYTCITKGTKLVWNKGVSVKSAASAPKPAPKYPTAPTSFDDLIANYTGISYAAWSKSAAAIKAAEKVDVPFKALVGPKTTLVYKNPEKIYDLVSRMYTGYKSAKDLTVLSFAYDDREWAEQQMKTIQSSSTWQWISYTACATRATCWGGGMHTDQNGSGLMVMTTEVVDENHTSGTLDAHEFTHAVQQNQMGRSQPWPPSGTWPPTWFLEGQANYTQYVAVYNDSFDLYTKKSRSSSEGLYKDSKITSQWIQDYFVVNPPSDWYNKYERWRQYDLGSMLVQVLTAIKGPASTMEVWKHCGTGMMFVDAFEKVYGISFEKALPIISKAIALQLGRS